MTAAWLFLKALPLRLVAVLVLIAVLLGALAYQHERALYWEQQSDQRDAQIARMKADVATDLVAASEAARLKDHAASIAAERIADATDQRIADATARAAGAERAAVGLRATVAALNSRPAPANPEARAFADEADIARELLESCSAEYTGLAAEADGLRIQVMGLQEFVNGPAGAGK